MRCWCNFYSNHDTPARRLVGGIAVGRIRDMKIFHLGDLHLGKVVHGISMTDADQPFWIKSFLEAVDV